MGKLTYLTGVNSQLQPYEKETVFKLKLILDYQRFQGLKAKEIIVSETKN